MILDPKVEAKIDEMTKALKDSEGDAVE